MGVDAAAHRGRVVMLVDNAVEGDSRVQKTARSAAESGWAVTLLGCGPVARTWSMDGATVRVLPMGGGRKRRLVARGGPAVRAARRARRPLDRARVWFWTRRHGDRSWRKLEPGLWNYERVFGPVIDELAPDLIHAHDFRMLGVGARAADRAKRAGRPVKLVWDAHEFLPGAPPRRDNARWLPAHLAYEREYVPAADAVVTVSDALAGLLQREHRLPTLPTVTLNAPLATAGAAPVPDLRALCGIGGRTPLLVYGGSATPQRGLDTVIRSLAMMDGVHLALVVADPDAPYIRGLTAADRVHAVPYVPHRQVPAFLSAADAGVIPIHHWPNHEIALITKFFEYSHARLPILVSDVRTMAATVRATGQGEVFRAGDAADFARAACAVLADPQRYRAVYDGPDSPLPGWTWEAQADKLDALYRRLLPAGAAAR
jgi:glycosyltransferase involved in cell wall biosynthesis